VDPAERVSGEPHLLDVPGAPRALAQVALETALLPGRHRVLEVIGHELDHLLAAVVAAMADDVAQLRQCVHEPILAAARLARAVLGLVRHTLLSHAMGIGYTPLHI
jgi:hypothetical protein